MEIPLYNLLFSIIILEMGSYFGKLSSEDTTSQKIDSLETQIECLKEINREQRADMDRLVSALKNGDKNVNSTEHNTKMSISLAEIDKIVEDMIKNEKVNIKYLPDFIEKRIYMNVFRVLMNVIQQISSTTKMEFLGHELNLQLTRPSNNICDSVETNGDVVNPEDAVVPDNTDGKKKRKKRKCYIF